MTPSFTSVDSLLEHLWYMIFSVLRLQTLQGCKTDCENCDNCEIANCDCEKNTISQITQFSFLTIGRNRNITQFDFLEGRNCESCENYYIEGFFFENGPIGVGFQISKIFQIQISYLGNHEPERIRLGPKLNCDASCRW